MKFLYFFILFIPLLSFSQAQSKAEFSGGNQAFQKEFMRMVYSYVDTKIYAVDGKFTFIIEIDETGKMKNLKVLPKVKNYEEFLQDMTFAMKRIKKKWKPATNEGKPVDSFYAFEIDFSTDYF